MPGFGQDIDGSFILTQRAERLVVPGFEKILFSILLAFSLLWAFYLRQFAPLVFQQKEPAIFEIELYRPEPDTVPAPLETAKPEKPVPIPIPEKKVPPATAADQEAEPRQNSKESNAKKQSIVELKEKVVELYQADHPDFTELPDSDLEAYRPGDVFDPRLADKIARQRQRKNLLRQAQGGTRGDEVYFDVHGVPIYRKGNTCFQLIEIPGIGQHWYAGKCAITRYEMEFEFNGKRY